MTDDVRLTDGYNVIHGRTTETLPEGWTVHKGDGCVYFRDGGMVRTLDLEGLLRELLAHRRTPPPASADADLRAAAWELPPVGKRPDGFTCLAFIRGRWEQARYCATYGGWQIKKGGGFFQPDHFAPLPTRVALAPRPDAEGGAV